MCFQRDIEFNQGFGATETTSLGTSTFKKTKNIDFSACGVPMAGVTLKFIDPATGQPVPIGQVSLLFESTLIILTNRDLANFWRSNEPRILTSRPVDNRWLRWLTF